MHIEKLPVAEYEKRHGPLPTWFKLPGCLVVRRIDVLTKEAHLSVELPVSLAAYRSAGL